MLGDFVVGWQITKITGEPRERAAPPTRRQKTMLGFADSDQKYTHPEKNTRFILLLWVF